MSEGKINRRGLLGLMAAAPVAAIAPTAAPARSIVKLEIDASSVRESVERVVANLNAYSAAYKERVDIWSPTRPPVSSQGADGRSDARRSERSDGPHRTAVHAPAAASDQPFNDHPILEHARAC